MSPGGLLFFGSVPEKNGQDDLQWISPYIVQNQNLNFGFLKSDHKNDSGEYLLDLYANNICIASIRLNVP